MYKLCMMLYKCLHSLVLDYLSELCTPVAKVAKWQHIHLASYSLLVVQPIQLDMYRHRAFVAVDPSLQFADNDLHDPDLDTTSFG